ncbi:MAG TPA: carboxylesterase family protein [Thermodesulfobacteriota bacterium]|jgi:para-nitrobenzyl esterase|nr:carboxylesterase family protein [Thermodesulfobacteriota bacterium]
MKWKSILRFKCVGVVLALALMTLPVGHVAAMDKDFDFHGDKYADLIVDPIKTDAGYVSGTTNDVINRCWIYIPCLLTGKTDTECTQCAELGEPGEAVRVYRGIPYAAPPVGDLRWKPPQPVTPWKGIRECTEFTPMAPQPFQPLNPFWGDIPESGMSEDCLYLNVATAAKHKNERLPVLVWFHGGGLTTGTNSPDDVYKYIGAEGGLLGASLPNHGVVIVTVQHRLGPIGYLAHPALSAESPHHTSGNYGQLDLIAALQWVQKNIAAFGGDPHRVTIFGQSGGGAKTSWLVGSPLAAGLFQRAKIQAGLTVSGTPLATAEGLGVNLAAKIGITDTGPAGLAALRAKTWQDIIVAANTPGSGYTTTFVADGYALPTGNFMAGPHNDVPLIVGMAGNDLAAIFTGTQKGLPTIAQHSPIYAYLFTSVPDGWKALGVAAWHGSEVAAEFGDTVALRLFPGALLPITLTADPGVTFKDVWVAEFMMSMLAEFAETGNPSVRKMGVHWPPYTEPQESYLDIGYKPLVKSGFTTLVEPVPPH